jgi:hypothetical protein
LLIFGGHSAHSLTACPHSLPALLLLLQIWDLFVRCPEASLEERFATFCDQLGDFLEGLVQRAVDVLELFFQLDAAEQQVGGWVQGWLYDVRLLLLCVQLWLCLKLY